MKAILNRLEGLAAGSLRLVSLILVGLCATTATAAAPTATAVWERNFVDNGVVRGTDGKDYKFTLNDNNNTVSDGIFKVGDSASLGGLIELGDKSQTKVTVLIKYSFAKAPTRSEVPVSLFCQRSGNAPDVGMVSWGSSNTTLVEYWSVINQGGYKDYSEFDNSANPALAREAGYILFSYDLSNVRGYVGKSIATLTGGVKTGINWGSSKITYVGLGGPTGKSNSSGGANSNAYPVSGKRQKPRSSFGPLHALE